MSESTPDIRIPVDLLPRDGRFGSGPSKVRREEVDALAATGTTYLGTSHRQATVRFIVAALRNGIAELLATRWRSGTAAPPRSGTPPPSA